HMSSSAIADILREKFAAEIYDADVAVFGPPPVRGVGKAGGFAVMIEDRGDLGPKALPEQVDNLTFKGMKDPGLKALFSSFRANRPQLFIEPNAGECMSKGVSLQDFADTLGVYQGSLYVNDFNLFDRTWQVIVQADGHYRDRIDEISRLAVRNQK